MATSLIRLPDVLARVGYRKSTVYKLVARNEFPKPIALGPRAKAWQSHEIDAWIAARIAASREAA